MKKNYFILVVTIACIQQRSEAQFKMGMYGTHTKGVNSLASPDAGYSFSVSFLTNGDSIARKKSKFPIMMQYGAEFYYSGIGKKTFYDVPLLAPQSGYSKVTLSNSLICVNAIIRFSFINKSVFTPYIDLFAGYRGTRSNLEILPYLAGSNQTRTHQSISTVDGINYGAGAGMMIAVGKQTKFDVGVSYAQAFQDGTIADLRSAYADANGINLNLKDSPNGIMMVHIGLIFYFDKLNISWNPGHHNNYYQNYYVPANGGLVGGTYTPPEQNGNRHWGPPTTFPGINRGRSIRSGGVNLGGNSGGFHMGGGGNWGGNSGGGSHVGVHIGGGGHSGIGHGK